MLMVWDGFVADLKGCYRSEFGLKIAITGVAKMGGGGGGEERKRERERRKENIKERKKNEKKERKRKEADGFFLSSLAF